MSNNHQSAKKILIIGPAWIGDMIMAQTLFKLLKQQNTNTTIDVAAPAWTMPLLERMPEVETAITIPIKHGELNLIKRYQLGKSLRAQAYDQVIVLPNSFKSALIPFWARIPKRTGWRGESRYGVLNDIRKLNKQQYPLMIERFMALGLSENAKLPQDIIPQFEINESQRLQALQTFNLTTDKPILALCPAAEYGPAKRWPAEYFATIAKEKLHQGWQVWLFGSEKDKEITAEIQKQSQSGCIDLAGKTDLGQAIDLLANASAVVTNDSGLMHVAAALQRPIVAIYGSSDPSFTPPLANRIKILRLGLSCSPCFKRECPLNHLKCLRDLHPQQVLQALDSL